MNVRNTHHMTTHGASDLLSGDVAILLLDIAKPKEKQKRKNEEPPERQQKERNAERDNSN